MTKRLKESNASSNNACTRTAHTDTVYRPYALLKVKKYYILFSRIKIFRYFNTFYLT